MGDKTKIEWCDASWNPFSGCSVEPLSPGCENCYARMMAIRMSKGHFKGIAKGKDWTGKVGFYPNILQKPLEWSRPRQIFVGSMGDLFYEGVTNEIVDKVFGIIKVCAYEERGHKFLILTKRPERMLEYLSSFEGLPLPNLWLGVSAENQERFDKRVPELLRCPAVGHFVSIEPMLGPVRMSCMVDWVVCGGESGSRGRPVHPEWVRNLRDQCSALRVPFMFKQWGMWKPVDWNTQATHAVRVTDGRVHKLDHKPGSAERAKQAPDGWQGIERLGKTKAGNELDGKVYVGCPWERLENER